MSTMIPCLAPQVCGVKSHFPGTIAKCRTKTPSPAPLAPKPPSTPAERLAVNEAEIFALDEIDVLALHKDAPLEVECMFEEITMYGSRDEADVYESVQRKVPDSSIEEMGNIFGLHNRLAAIAVGQAIDFYRDEAGGSHEFEVAPHLNLQGKLNALPQQ